MSLETGHLLRFCRARLRQLVPQGYEPPLKEMTRAELMLEAARGPRLLARAQADIFHEITRFVLRDMEENMRQAPYVLQTWVDGVYFYYFVDGNWRPEHVGAKQFLAHTEAEAFIRDNFDPNQARDAILVVPLHEVERV